MPSVQTPPSDLPLRVAVIGGGITGLAATHRLAELLPQAEFEIFEASSRLGGVLHTVERDGYRIEQSADNFLVKPPAGIDLCRDLGITDDLLTTDESRRRAFVVRRGRLVPIPEGFYLMSPRRLWPILASPIISLRGKLRLFAEPLIGRATDTRDESVASFARRRLGVEVFEQLVQPLVAGIYTADPEQLSMAATMPQFVEYRAHPRQPASIDAPTVCQRQDGPLQFGQRCAVRSVRRTAAGHDESRRGGSQSAAENEPETQHCRDSNHSDEWHRLES